MLKRQLMMGLLSVTLICAAADRALASDVQTLYAAGLDAATEQDYARALGYFQQAAALGHRDAQRTSGMMLMYGEALYGAAVPTRKTEATAWLKAAAGAGCEVSAFLLSRPRNGERRA
jgi:TPR repeat protein